MRPQCYLLIAFTALATTAATAQRRSVGSTLLLPEIQAELALKGDDYLLLGVRGPISTGSYKGTTLDQLGLNLGYERFWNEQWSGGATLRTDVYSAYRNGTDVSRLYVNTTPELFVRHWSTIGAFNFRQRLGVEYFVPGGDDAKSRAITRLRFDLDRVFPLGQTLALRPRMSYEAAAYLRLQRDESEEKERVIDFGNMRAELGVRVSPRLDFTPWVASQTTYINALVQRDANGNPTSGGRTNLLTPVVGLDVRLTLFTGGSVFERRQLPTQH